MERDFCFWKAAVQQFFGFLDGQFGGFLDDWILVAFSLLSKAWMERSGGFARAQQTEHFQKLLLG